MYGIILYADITMKGSYYLSESIENQNFCRSFFKDGGTETIVERYTAVWIRLINLMEMTRYKSFQLPEDQHGSFCEMDADA